MLAIYHIYCTALYITVHHCTSLYITVHHCTSPHFMVAGNWPDTPSSLQHSAGVKCLTSLITLHCTVVKCLKSQISTLDVFHSAHCSQSPSVLSSTLPLILVPRSLFPAHYITVQDSTVQCTVQSMTVQCSLQCSVLCSEVQCTHVQCRAVEHSTKERVPYPQHDTCFSCGLALYLLSQTFPGSTESSFQKMSVINL